MKIGYFVLFIVSHLLRDGHPASIQRTNSSRRQRVAPPIFTGRGTLPAALALYHAALDKPHNAQASLAVINML
jgi:hypothetical protein